MDDVQAAMEAGTDAALRAFDPYIGQIHGGPVAKSVEVIKATVGEEKSKEILQAIGYMSGMLLVLRKMEQLDPRLGPLFTEIMCDLADRAVDRFLAQHTKAAPRSEDEVMINEMLNVPVRES